MFYEKNCTFLKLKIKSMCLCQCWMFQRFNILYHPVQNKRHYWCCLSIQKVYKLGPRWHFNQLHQGFYWRAFPGSQVYFWQGCLVCKDAISMEKRKNNSYTQKRKKKWPRKLPPHLTTMLNRKNLWKMCAKHYVK